jgi:hypothetical protein
MPCTILTMGYVSSIQMNESFKVYAMCIWGGIGLVAAVICVMRVNREIDRDSLVRSMVSADPEPKSWHYKFRRKVVLPLLMAALAFLAWPIFFAILAWDKGVNIADWWPSRDNLKKPVERRPVKPRTPRGLL